MPVSSSSPEKRPRASEITIGTSLSAARNAAEPLAPSVVAVGRRNGGHAQTDRSYGGK